MKNRVLNEDLDGITSDVDKITSKLMSVTHKFFDEYIDHEDFPAIFTSCALSYSLTVIDKISDGFLDADSRDDYISRLQISFNQYLELVKNKSLDRCLAQH